MDVTQLNVRTREATGRGSSRRLRKADEIPAVVYGRSGNEALAVSVSAFQKLWKHMAGGAALVEIRDENGKTRLTSIKEIQRDPIKDNVLHIDFNEVYAGELMTATVPFATEGTPVGVKEHGGILESSVYELEVRCFPKNLPEHLTLDVSALEVGESVHVSSLNLPEGVEVTNDSETVLAYVAPPISEKEMESEAETPVDEVPTVADEEQETSEDSGEPSKDEESAEKADPS